MLPGPTIIRQCSACSGFLLEYSLDSGNTIGSTYWTDTKPDSPMLPMEPDVIKCPHCNVALWIDKQEIVGQQNWKEELRPIFSTATHGNTLSAEEYFDFIATHTHANKKNEEIVRFSAMWKANDARRDHKSQSALSPAEIENLKALSRLVSVTSSRERLLQCEFHRLQGRFDEAARFLNGEFFMQHRPVAEFFRDLVRQKDCRVQRIE